MSANNTTNPEIHKFIKQYVTKEYRDIVESCLTNEQECTELAEEIIHSTKMTSVLSSVKNRIIEHYSVLNQNYLQSGDSLSSASFSLSDINVDEWNPTRDDACDYTHIIEKIRPDQPDHVRLAGYEILLKSDLTTICSSPIWNDLLECLKFGIIDESRPVFEASLQVHARLLDSPQSSSLRSNMLNAITVQQDSNFSAEILPTFISGINFKVFFHEKIFRIMHLILRHHEEILKTQRNADKALEETIESFIMFLSTHSFGASAHPKTLSILNVLSILEPRAGWAFRWNRTLFARRIFSTALGKSPMLLHKIVECAEGGLKEASTSSSISIYDCPIEVSITGDTIMSSTYLHCLSFLSLLLSCDTGRATIDECLPDTRITTINFVKILVDDFNKLPSFEIRSGVYNVCRDALKTLLNASKVSFSEDLYATALKPIVGYSENNIRVWPHTVDILNHMLKNPDDAAILVIEHKNLSNQTKNQVYPAVVILQYLTNLLTQPFSMMITVDIISLLQVVQEMLHIHGVEDIIKTAVEKKFLPALANFYRKIDKYFLENETKTQQLDSEIKRFLLKIVTLPFCLELLARESLLFEELIRGSISPLRASWTDNELTSFVSSAAYFDLGIKVLTELSSHVLSTLLIETCRNLNDPRHFYDPWDNNAVSKFLHVLALFSLNFKCFNAFMTKTEIVDDREDDCPRTLTELLYESVNIDSPYHYLGLLSLNVNIWNLDIYLILIDLLDFQNALLKHQKYCIEEGKEEEEDKTVYIIDENSLLRNKILIESYYMRQKLKNNIINSNECVLFSTLPPPDCITEENSPVIENLSSTLDELELLLLASGPGFRDGNWVAQAMQAYENSLNPLKEMVLVNLLDQMESAIPTTEWIDDFKWKDEFTYNADYWFPEEIHGIDLSLHYAELNNVIKKSEEAAIDLGKFIQASYNFIKYERSCSFDGFDWFLSTIFIISEGKMNTCKTVIMQIMRFPAIIYLWPKLGKTLIKNRNKKLTTNFIFAQLLESIVNSEFPQLNFAFKDICGANWWQICTTMLQQCFWSILPWSEIKSFIALCLLYETDYILYYCVSLLYHCQHNLMHDLTNGKSWPENMVFDDYHCHNYIPFMYSLEKRYRNKILPMMTSVIHDKTPCQDD